MRETVAAGSRGLPAPRRSLPGEPRRKRDGHPKANPDAWSSFVSKLVIEDLSVPKKRRRVSLATLRKVLASTSLELRRNYGRIKLGLRSLVGKGALGHTIRTRAMSAPNVSKNAGPEPPKTRGKKPPSVRTKKPVSAQNSKSPKSKKTTRSTRTRMMANKTRKSGKKMEGAAVSPRPKSSAKTPRTEKSKRAKPKLTQQAGS